jgi:hypothetical protein
LAGTLVLTLPFCNARYHIREHLFADRMYRVRFGVRYRTASGLRKKLIGRAEILLDDIVNLSVDGLYDEWLLLRNESRQAQGFIRVQIAFVCLLASGPFEKRTCSLRSLCDF